MKGCRPLSDHEIRAVARQLARGPKETRFRNLALWYLMLKSGLRITEALSLGVGDVWDGSGFRTHLKLRRAATKGARAGATLPLHPAAKRALRTFFTRERRSASASDPLFKSEKTGGRLTRNGAWRFLRQALDAAGIHGQTGWHSTRKSYCQRVYKALDYDLVSTRAAMRHAEISTTAAYLCADRGRVESAILSI